MRQTPPAAPEPLISAPTKTGADLSPRAAYPQHIQSLPTELILGMRERPHWLAAQSFTGAKQSGALVKSFFQFDEDRLT
jgi:hypothetical protein